MFKTKVVNIDNHIFLSLPYSNITLLPRIIAKQLQHAKKVVSDSPGLVDFAIGLVIFVLNLPYGQVLFLGEIQITEGLTNSANQKGFWGHLK